MAITAEMTTSVMELYTAYFNRAADRAGVDYWLSEMDTNGWTVDMVAQSFAQQTEYTALYAGLTNAQIVAQVYTNVLGRTADTDGATYWEGRLSDTESPIPVNQFIQAVVTAATEEVGGVAVNVADKAVVENKSAVSQYCYDLDINETGISLDLVTEEYGSINSLIVYIDEISSYEEWFGDEEEWDDEGWGETETWSDELGTWIIMDAEIESTIGGDFDFTQEWISGKTLVYVYGNQDFAGTVDFFFSYDNAVNIEGSSYTYSVDSEGNLTLSSDLGTIEFKALDAFYTLNAVEVEVGTGSGEPNGFFALDQETANYLVDNFYDLL